MKKTFLLIILTTFLVFGSISCQQSDMVAQEDGKKIQIFLPKLSDSYLSVYQHWGEFDLNTMPLMDKPLLDSNDIESMDNKTIKVKKNFIIVNGTGMENSLIFDDNYDGNLKFEYDGKEYEVNSQDSELFYNYTVYDICVVRKGNDIILVKQKDYIKEKDSGVNLNREREYKKSIIGIPYVLVVDGKRTELGVLKIADAEFAVPGIFDSWCYMGMPEGLVERLPEGMTLQIIN